MKLLFALLTGPGKIRTGVRYDGPEDISKAEQAQTDPTKPMKNMSERLRGDSSMMKNHTPRRFMKKRMIEYMTEVIRSYIEAHGAEIPAWQLVKVITKLAEVGAGFAEEGPEEVKVKRFEASPQLIYKDEDGCKYKTKFEISHGKPNRYMKAAHEQYGKNSRWLQVPYASKQEANFQKAVFSQAGCNRQGFGTWGCWKRNGSPLNNDNWTSTEIYNYYGLPSEGMIANEWARTGVETTILTQLNDQVSNQDFFRTYYNVDLLTNINSRFSTHTFYNSQEFSDLNIKVYVCQAKRATTEPIWNSIASFGATINNDFKVPEYSPAARSSGGAGWNNPIKATGAGFNWFSTPTTPVKIYHTANDGTTTMDTDANVEVSSVLGVTPLQSQAFKADWEVLDVLNNSIGPNDTWEVHLEQKYNKSHSVRSWYERFDKLELGASATYSNVLKATSRGDIVLLTVFSGMPASNYVLDGTDQTNTFPVEAGPSRIRHEVRHGINISWPQSLQPLDMAVPDVLSGNLKDGWRVIQQKTNYTDRETYDYDRGEIKVSTRANIQDDKPKSDVTD
jgi:hypothetical protein